MNAAPSDRGAFAQAVLLAALAGAVDAVGFVHWRGLFLSFMSGNSTVLGVSAALSDWEGMLVSGAAIGSFVVGVAAGELLSAAFGAGSRPGLLAIEAVLLGIGAGAAFHDVTELAAAPLLSFTMGLQNAAIRRAGGISVALTYVTGTLVNVGRGIAAALRGAGPLSATLPYLGLWCGLVAGAALGTAVTLRAEWFALAGAAGLALLLALVSLLLGERHIDGK